MARIAGVNIPVQKHTWVGLTHIYGIGKTRAYQICEAAGVAPETRNRDLTEGEEKALKVIPRRVLLGLAAGGAILYGAVGIAGMLLGGNFLDYSVLAEDPVKGQQLGILLIEAGVGITVTGVLLSIFHAFAARDR